MSTKLEYFWDRTYASGRNRVLLHILFWIAYLSFLSATAYQHLTLDFPVKGIADLLIWICPVYLLAIYYFVITYPYSSFQKKHFVRASFATFLAFIIYIHFYWLYSYFLQLTLKKEGISLFNQIGNFYSFYFSNITSFVAIMHQLFGFVIYLLLPIACKFFRDTQRSAKQFRELKERNLQLELNLIKSQVNPHFLLNTLNNIHGIALNGTLEDVDQMILSLSGFLKYSLYECNNEFVPLNKEIKLIENFIELEAVRSEYINVIFDVKLDNEHHIVPPFILFPLIENAFKHGTRDLLSPTAIVAALSVRENRLFFKVENELPLNEAKPGGLGLSALKKKIEYYYPYDATLICTKENNKYIAELQISNLCRD